MTDPDTTENEAIDPSTAAEGTEGAANEAATEGEAAGEEGGE